MYCEDDDDDDDDGNNHIKSLIQEIKDPESEFNAAWNIYIITIIFQRADFQWEAYRMRAYKNINFWYFKRGRNKKHTLANWIKLSSLYED